MATPLPDGAAGTQINDTYLHSTKWSDNLATVPLFLTSTLSNFVILTGYQSGGTWTHFGNSDTTKYARGYRQGNHVHLEIGAQWKSKNGGTAEMFQVSLFRLQEAGWFDISKVDPELSTVAYKRCIGIAMFTRSGEAPNVLTDDILAPTPILFKQAITAPGDLAGTHLMITGNYNKTDGGAGRIVACDDVKGDPSTDGFLSFVLDLIELEHV